MHVGPLNLNGCHVLPQKIAGGALVIELAAVVVLGATIVAFDYFSQNSDSSGFSYY